MLDTSLLRQTADKVYTVACQEAKYKFDQAVQSAWVVYHQARGIEGLSREDARLRFREVISPAEVEYHQDLQEAAAKRSLVIQEWVRPR